MYIFLSLPELRHCTPLRPYAKVLCESLRLCSDDTRGTDGADTMSTTARNHSYGHPWPSNPDLPPQYQPPHVYAQPKPHVLSPPPRPGGHYQDARADASRGAGSDESIYVQRKAAFDNPLASNAEWSPAREDWDMYSLPKVDIMLRVKARLNRKAGNPFDPPPRSFQRAPRLAAHARRPFEPIILKSDGKTGLIGAGFKPSYVGPVLAAHDVSAADFHRFLEDIFTAGKVGAGGQVVAGVAPVTMHLGVTGYFVTKAILKGMCRRNEPLVVDTIETWQARFFGPRGLDVYVVQNGVRCTARSVGCGPGPLSGEVARAADAVSGASDKKRKHKDKNGGAPCLVIGSLN